MQEIVAFSLLRRAFRNLQSAPGFTLLAMLTLAVGIGATTAVFSVVDGVLLRPLPYPQPDRLVSIFQIAPGLGLGQSQIPQSIPLYLLYRQRAHRFADLAIYMPGTANLSGGEAPERVPAALTSASFLRVLKITPRIGRAFTAEDERPGAPAVTLLSDPLWRRSFDADPKVVGRTLRIDGVPTRVVGILPASFAFPSPGGIGATADVSLLFPLPIDPLRAQVGNFNCLGIGRLRPGVSAAQGQDDLNGLLAQLPRLLPSEDSEALAKAHLSAVVDPLRDVVVREAEKVLWVLFGAVGCILLIACVNVANLLIVRGEGRRKEIAIHTALGAPRRRLIGAVLAESLLLALAAGALGLLLAEGGLRLLLALKPAHLPRLSEVHLDFRVLAFAAVVSLLSSLLFGLLPAFRATGHRDLTAELKGSSRTATLGLAGRRLRQLLVGFQLALALVLLTGSLLLLQSFLRLLAIQPGFATDHVLTAAVDLPEAEYADDARAARFWSDLVSRLATLPGVISVGATSSLPLTGSGPGTGHLFADVPLPAHTTPPILYFDYVTDRYFDTLGIPLLAGRGFTPADGEGRTGAVIVSAALARHYWPHGSPLGRRLRPARESGLADPWYTVVGVVGDVRNRQLDQAPDELIYYPPLGKAKGEWTARQMTLVLHTRVPPASLAGAVRQAVRALAPDLPVAHIATMEQVVRDSRGRSAFSALMLLLATGVALVLGGVGIYGFVSYLVTQRTAEIGVRVALGASARRIRWMILYEALEVTAAGLVLGLVGAALLTRGLSSLLFEVSPLDPVTFVSVPLLIALLTLMASYFPAERAARIDPLRALQQFE
ncbi:MAG TPA: ABC transporter permease [Thermoanaerobaculia bacterium]|nr:ABC transporter permease [Thermoanaerobaculia bacterium]